MTIFEDAVQDLAAMSRRGAITGSELRRMLTYLLQSGAESGPDDSSLRPTAPTGGPSPPQGGPGANTGASSPSVPSRQRRRRFLGRGTYGWVNQNQAQTLDLVALLELGGSGTRPDVLGHIERKWGGHFTRNDREELAAAQGQRWEKTCNFGFHYLYRDGLIRRPERGVQLLTDAGIREAEARRRSLPD